MLIAWEKLKFPDCEKNYVELLNNLVGSGVAKFKTNSKRFLSRNKVECSKAKRKLQESRGEKQKKQRRISQFLDKTFNPEK